MPRLVPPIIYPGCASPGEKDIFEKFKHSSQAEDWIVLHSYNIADHIRQITGEADFLVVAPGKGVLCLEIKAHQHICRTEGLWHYGNNPPEARGPFVQASEAMYSVRQKLLAKRSDLYHIPFFSAVIMPRTDMQLDGDPVEWHPWQLIDAKLYRHKDIVSLLEDVFDRSRQHLSEVKSASWFNINSNSPTLEECQRILATLRPDFENIPSTKSRRRMLVEELAYYTAEQVTVLDRIEDNPRVLLSGPAGTGKTLLAIEAARRARAKDRKALLLCYSSPLGDWLKSETKDLVPEVTTTTIGDLMLAITGETPPEAVDEAYWHKELPEHAQNVMLDRPDARFIFDELVIDEAQDIIRQPYLDLLDISLKGGLESGAWRIFGDFEKQAVFSDVKHQTDSLIEKSLGHGFRYSLRENCRNTEPIVDYLYRLCGLQPGYRVVHRGYHGDSPHIEIYETVEHQRDQLVTQLELLYKKKYRGEDIVILSAHPSQSVVDGLPAKPWGDRIRALGTSGKGYIRSGRVEDFKGLEAPVVIVTDIEQVSGWKAISLLYVGISRAVDRLLLFLSQDAATEVSEKLLAS